MPPWENKIIKRKIKFLVLNTESVASHTCTPVPVKNRVVVCADGATWNITLSRGLWIDQPFAFNSCKKYSGISCMDKTGNSICSHDLGVIDPITGFIY